MLALTCERAGVEDGMDAARSRLRLGLAHRSGSAERYPPSRIMAVSNSRPQREFIEARAPRRT